MGKNANFWVKGIEIDFFRAYYDNKIIMKEITLLKKFLNSFFPSEKTHNNIIFKSPTL